MKAFFDLDDVLFDTGAFVAATGDIFERQGVPLDVFYETYAQARLIGNDVLKVYSFSAHVDILSRYVPNLNAAALSLQYEKLFADTRQYVFPDVTAVLEGLKQRGMHLYVVSFGIEKVQRAKVEGSGLMMFLDGFFVGTEAKSHMIRPALDDSSSTWFIDDQPKFIEDVKTVFPYVTTVQMMRKNGRFVNERHLKSDFIAENMQDVGDVIFRLDEYTNS